MPRGRKAVNNESIYAAALEGLLLQRQRIEEQIRQVRALLGKRRGPAPASIVIDAGEKPARKKRQLSPAARKRIALAQKRRWAEYRKATAGEKSE